MSAATRPEVRPPEAETVAAGAAIARSAFHLVLGQVATTALAIAFSAVVGRRLGAADFGVFFLVTTMGTFANVVVEWGQSQLLVRELARRADQAGRLLGAALALRLAGSVPACGLVVAIGWALGYEARTLALLALLMLTTLPFFLSQAHATVFRARERMDLDAQVSVLFKALAFPFALFALLAGGRVAGVLLAQGAAGIAALALAAVRSRRLGVSPLRPAGADCRELLREGTPILAMSLAITVQPYIDAIMLSRLLPAAPVGWYGAARNIMGTLVAPATILGAAAYPRLSRAAGDAAHLRLELRTALRPLLGLGALGAVGTYLFADLAVSIIYGKSSFAPAAAILQVFSPALFLVCIDVLFMSAVLAVGRPRALAAAKAVNVLVCSGIAFAAIPWFQQRYGNGGLGLVAAFGASEVMMFAASILILPRRTLDVSFVADLGRTLAAAALTLLLFRLLPPLSPVLGVPLCIGAFGAAAAALGLVRGGEVRAISAMFRRRAPAAAEPPP